MTIETIARECIVIPKPYNKTADTDVVIADELYLYGYVNCFNMLYKFHDTFFWNLPTVTDFERIDFPIMNEIEKCIFTDF